jgi:hypothetical protein
MAGKWVEKHLFISESCFVFATCVIISALTSERNKMLHNSIGPTKILLFSSVLLFSVVGCADQSGGESSSNSSATTSATVDGDSIFDSKVGSGYWSEVGFEDLIPYSVIRQFAKDRLCTSITAGASNEDLREMVLQTIGGDWPSLAGTAIGDATGDQVISAAKESYCP